VLDLVAPQAIVDVDAGQYPDLARSDEGHEQLADRHHARVRDDEGTDLVLDHGRRLLAEQEVVVSPCQLHADADEQQPEGDRGHRFGHRRSGDLMEGDARERDGVTDDRCGVLGEHRPHRRIRREHDLVDEVTAEAERLVLQLPHRPEQRHRLEDDRARQHRVDHRERRGPDGCTSSAIRSRNEKIGPMMNTPIEAINAQK